MRQELLDLSTQYLQAGDAIHDAVRGKGSEDRWQPLKGSNILFYQTILSIAKTIDEYL